MRAKSFKRTNFAHKSDWFRLKLLWTCSANHICVYKYVDLYTQACVTYTVCSRLQLMHGKTAGACRSSGCGGGVKRGRERFPHSLQKSHKEREAWKWDELEQKRRKSQNTHRAFRCVSFCSHTLKDNDRLGDTEYFKRHFRFSPDHHCLLVKT